MATPNEAPDEASNEAPDEVLTLSSEGDLILLQSPAAAALPARVREAFAESGDLGLLHLGLLPTRPGSAVELGFWQELSRLFLLKLCMLPGLPELAAGPIDLPPPREELSRMAAAVPPMPAAEDVNADLLERRWRGLLAAFSLELERSGESPQAYFERHGSAWTTVGRVCFHLAENRGSEETPFAFLATYSHRVSGQGKAQHLPLGRALQEYAGEGNRERLLHLLLPVRKAARESAFLKNLVDQGEIFHPLAWSPAEAYRFLKDIPVFEASGVIVRVPDWWKGKRPARPQVSVRVGGEKSGNLGLKTLLEFKASVTLDGQELTEEELRRILAGTNGLALVRGRWVEIDPGKLKEVLTHWKKIENAAGKDGISFIDGMRLLSGASFGANGEGGLDSSIAEWSRVTAGEELARQLERLREPDGKLKDELRFGPELKAELRPYQRVGIQWLWLLHRLGLGGCLADDMGLGKTLQVIALLLLIRRERRPGSASSLLVVPASLLGNWKSELEKFAPALRYVIVHPSAAKTPKEARALVPPLRDENPDLSGIDVVITTYGYVGKLPWILESSWETLILDEAQAIKNSGSRQTRTVKAIPSRHRIALTGTPIENRLSDLWSLFDFLCPGLLGSGGEFERYARSAAKSGSSAPYAALRHLIRPYLLRRLKTDRRIISDLPEKTEVAAYCSLTPTQAALYQESVEELTRKIEKVKGIQRRGLVLAYLMRFKQICNHPSQWLRDGGFEPAASGKFSRLGEICEEVAARREKALIFTQFREMTAPLAEYLSGVFGRPGLILHGETAVRKRRDLVEAFQDDRGPPFFVLSLKAGGTGLNLTAASHVIHFDRWWNPAVENQATDRAYRIGQKKNVMVHRFICRGTIEEKVDELIAGKKSLSRGVLEEGGEAFLTELSNSELLKLVSLDIRSALMDS